MGLKKSLEQVTEDPLQSRITDCWNIMDSVEPLQYKNEKVSTLLRGLELSLAVAHQDPIKLRVNNLLHSMISNAEQNCGKYPTKQKHSSTIKKFVTALFLYGLRVSPAECSLRHCVASELFKVQFMQNTNASMGVCLDLIN